MSGLLPSSALVFILTGSGALFLMPLTRTWSRFHLPRRTMQHSGNGHGSFIVGAIGFGCGNHSPKSGSMSMSRPIVGVGIVTFQAFHASVTVIFGGTLLPNVSASVFLIYHSQGSNYKVEVRRKKTPQNSSNNHPKSRRKHAKSRPKSESVSQ